VKVASVDNLLFFLLIAAAALFQLLSKALKKASKNETDDTPKSPTPQRPPPIRRAPAQSDADRIRKFLEALGQPPGSSPPPPVLPRTEVPPRRLAPVQPPPVIPGAWRLPPEQRQKPEITQKESLSPEQPSRLHEIVPPPVPAPVAPAFEVHEGALPVELQEPSVIKTPVESDAAASQVVAKRAGSRTDIATLLGSKSSLREAILIREILGPPRGLHELDAVL
jgi:hypothetical protein